MSRWIRVDDFDRRINYSTDGWRALQVSGVTTEDYDFRNLQDAFLGTTHAVVGTDYGTQSSFSFTFNGTAVAIYGMYVGLTGTCSQNCTAADVVTPVWTCSIDGETIRSNDAFGHFPWKSYCEKDGLEDGPHIISAEILHRNVSVPSGFYLDFIQYRPNLSSLSSGLEQGYLMIDSTDPQIPFTEEWSSLGTANMTLAGGDFWLEFTGVWLIWYSLSPHAINTLDPSLLKNETVDGGVLCQYTIDGQDPVNFMMALGPDTLKPNTYNNILLQTATLPAGKHNLTVSGFWFGHATTLDYLIVQPGPLVSNAATSTSTTAPSDTSLPLLVTATQVNNSSISTESHHINVGAVVGGTIGGAFLLVVMVICILFYKRRKSSAADVDSVFDAEPLPAHIRLEPFKDSLDKPPATAPSGGSGSQNYSDTVVPSSQPKKLAVSRLRSCTEIASASSSRSHLPLIPPIAPMPDMTIDPFLDLDLFKPSGSSSSNFSLNYNTPEAHISSSSIPSHLQPLLSAEQRTQNNAHPLNNSPPPTHDSQPRHINDQQGAESGDFLELDEHDDLLDESEPPHRASGTQQTTGTAGRRASRIVRHSDSGIRLTRTRYSERIVELPPEYTME